MRQTTNFLADFYKYHKDPTHMRIIKEKYEEIEIIAKQKKNTKNSDGEKIPPMRS